MSCRQISCGCTSGKICYVFNDIMSFLDSVQQELDNIKESGLYKNEIQINSAQGIEITTSDNKKLVNMCANNYLGFANDFHE